MLRPLRRWARGADQNAQSWLDHLVTGYWKRNVSGFDED